MKESEPNVPKEELPLGLMQLPNNTFEHDLAVSNKYQSFSTELLRLSLLGIAAIGFLVANILAKDVPHSNSYLKYSLSISLACLGLSAGCALLHGYASADAIAYQLGALRREVRRSKDKDDVNRAKEEKKKMWKSFRREIGLTIVSGIFLWLGAVALAISFIVML